jgi:aminopeptidase N
MPRGRARRAVQTDSETEIHVPGMNLTRDEARERASHLTVSSYDVSLDLTAGEETFGSRTVVHFSSSRPGTDTFLDLVAPVVSRVVLNGQELDVATAADGTRVRLPSLAADNEVFM